MVYNHHYEAYLRNSENSFQKVRDNKYDPDDSGQYNHGAHKIFRLIVIDTLSTELFNDNALYFSEGNGEFRASFHGYQADMLSYWTVQNTLIFNLSNR